MLLAGQSFRLESLEHRACPTKKQQAPIMGSASAANHSSTAMPLVGGFKNPPSTGTVAI